MQSSPSLFGSPEYHGLMPVVGVPSLLKPKSNADPSVRDQSNESPSDCNPIQHRVNEDAAQTAAAASSSVWLLMTAKWPPLSWQ